MDLISHAAAGALIAHAAAPKQRPRSLVWLGALAALIPDADVFIGSSTDPLLTLEYHRHFSHALITAPVIALLLTLIYRLGPGRELPFGRLFLALTAAVVSAGLLDLCTGYGVHLLWPFIEQRYALYIIAVVDPVMTILLLSGLLMIGPLRIGRRGAVAALSMCLVYLGIGTLQQQRSELALARWAERSGITVERLLVKPTLGNQLLWRGLVQGDGQYHIVALRAGLGTVEILPGAPIPRWTPERDPIPIQHSDSSQAKRDVMRFAELSGHWLVRHPQDHEVLGDIRYAMLPDWNRPLWGVRLPKQAGQRVTLEEFQDASREIGFRFLGLLRGEGGFGKI